VIELMRFDSMRGRLTVHSAAVIAPHKHTLNRVLDAVAESSGARAKPDGK
jgi:hypothetical protein